MDEAGKQGAVIERNELNRLKVGKKLRVMGVKQRGEIQVKKKRNTSKVEIFFLQDIRDALRRCVKIVFFWSTKDTLKYQDFLRVLTF